MALPDVPSSMEARVRHMYGDLSDAERKLADVVLARQDELLGYTATELAQLAGTSKSTAARFFRRAGFAGFDEFRQQVRAHHTRQSPLARMAQVQRKDSLAQQLHTHLRQDAQRLADWADALPEAQVQGALALLSKARKVWVVGYRHSRVTAGYAQALLAQVRSDVVSLNDASGREAELLASASERDVVLAVDFRRRSTRLPVVLAAARSMGAQVVLLTDAPVSALAMQAQVVLRCGASDPDGLFDSYVCAISLMNFLAGAFAAHSKTGTQARLQRIEQLHVVLGDLEPQL